MLKKADKQLALSLVITHPKQNESALSMILIVHCHIPILNDEFPILLTSIIEYNLLVK